MFPTSDAISMVQGIRISMTFPYQCDTNTVRTPSQWETPTTFPITSPDEDVTTCTDPLVGSSAIESPWSVYV